MLKVSDVYKSFGKTQVLKGISLEVKKGQVLAVIGPSGAGKTTLLRCLNSSRLFTTSLPKNVLPSSSVGS